MIPRAKKNLHECEYHLKKMVSSRNVEELEINFAAFVNSARNVTFVLKKEFINHPQYKKTFLTWYGDLDSPEAGTKSHEMSSDDLCIFFKKLRNSILKEGINGIVCNTHIESFNSSTDLPDKPPNASIQISSRGIYYLINKGTTQEDSIPARTTARITTSVFIADPPNKHLDQAIPNNQKDIFNLSNKYYEYLKSVVDEWTGILNNSK
ncbi:MAG: hypothetical protein ACE5IC_01150 [Candidatus Brocadiales bacterium]